MDLNMLVVEAGAPEVDAILRIEAEAFGTGAMTVWAVDPFAAHGRCQLFRSEGRDVAEALWLADWRDRELAYLFSFAVVASERGKGLGRRVLAMALDDLRGQGRSRFELTVDPRNEAAVTLYRGAGFRERSMRRDVYGPGEDRLVLRLEDPFR